MRRYLLHVLPSGIKRIRHYGVLASACKGDKLNAARLALPMPQPNPQAKESAQGFMARVAKIDLSLCPCCKVGCMQVTAVLQGHARLPAPTSAVAQHSAIRLLNAMMQGTVPVRHDDDWLKTTQAQS